MDEELRPCPWCRMNPVVFDDVDIRDSWQIKCRNRACPANGVSTTWYSTREEAVAAWNTRPVEDALRAENERLRTALAWYADADNWEPIIEHRRGFIGYGPSNVATDYDVEMPSAEVERLRTALAWYADADNWEPIIEHRRGFIGYGPSNVATDYDVEMPSAAVADYGDRARVALAGEGVI